LVERTEEIAQLISAENGKPIKWARGPAVSPVLRTGAALPLRVSAGGWLRHPHNRIAAQCD
ncbi:hypothetical protein ACWEQ1_35265, partial [Streptomyces nodosus]